MIMPLQKSNGLMHLPQGKPVTMSSREVAELVESRHDKVKQSIERLAARGVITLPPMGEASFIGTNGRKQYTSEYRIGERDSYVIVAQLSPEFTARLVDRWQELEGRAADPHTTIPQTLPEALRMAADLAEQNSQLAATMARQQQKVDALALISAADGDMSLTAAAKVPKQRPRKFCEYLHQLGWIHRNASKKQYQGYESKVEAGLITHRIHRVERADGSEKLVAQVLVTPRGLAKLASILSATNGGVV